MAEQNPAHLFFSYAHKDEGKLLPIHAQMQNVLERNLWVDKVGIDRGEAWENAIKAAIDDSYGVIFAVTKAFVASKFIRDKEITWTLARFKDKQGAQIFPILFDDVDVPDDLKTPFITYQIDARDGDMERVYKELKRVLPEAKPGTQPFVVSWPRLTNFKGRDSQLIDLHKKLVGDGQVGINTKSKTAGLYGMGGIGKTQLAVEYAHRYRYHYPGGVYWLNAGADWQKEVAACAVNLDRSLVDKKDEEKALAFRDWLKDQDQEALVVLDNVDDPAEITRREIAPKLTLFDLRGQTKVRLLLTTRMQTMPTGFESVSVNVLDKMDARAVLLDAWVDSEREDKPDINELDAIAEAIGRLPLALGWIEAALRQLPDTTPAELLSELKARGLDDLIQELQSGNIDIGTPEYHDRLVGSVLDWQIKHLKSADSPNLLALTAAFGEAAVVPLERLRLMMGLAEKGLIKPFAKAVKDVQAYSLVETLNEGTAFRLHPLTQDYVRKHYEAAERLVAAVPRLVAAYRDPVTLDLQTIARGFGAVLSDLKSVLPYREDDQNLQHLTWLLTLEEPHLLVIPNRAQAGYVIQQIRERAYHEEDNELKAACEQWLEGKQYIYHYGEYYPTNKGFLRALNGHRNIVNDAIVLANGRILSWSGDKTLRLWAATGEALATLIGHSRSVTGAIVLADGRILSWSWDKTLRLWAATGEALATLIGHNNIVNGAMALADGHILSWAGDSTLRLWTTGEALATLDGHNNIVTGAIALADGHILSWSADGTLRLWTASGETLATLKGHTDSVTGAIALADGHILSWSADGTLRLWTASGETLATLKGHTDSVTGAIALADGHILSWSGDGTLRLWAASGEALATLKGHSRNVIGAIALADGRILSWSGDGTLRLWTASGETLATLEGHTDGVTGAIALADGRILSWSVDGTLRLWTTSGEALTLLTGHSSIITGAIALADGRILSWSGDSTLRLWTATGETPALLKRHTDWVSNTIALADGHILSWSYDRTLRLWAATGEALATLKGHIESVTGAIALADGYILSWSNDSTLRLWAATGEALTTLKGHTDRVIGAIALADRHILSWSVDGTLRLWAATGETLTTLKGHTDRVTNAISLVDGRILSWSVDRTLRLWTTTGEALTILKGHMDSVTGAIPLADGRILSWSVDRTLRLWTATGKALTTLKGHTDSVTGAIALADGRILSWSNDATLRLWTASGEALATLKGHTEKITGAIVLTDGHILSWSVDRTLRLWSTTGEALTTLKRHTERVTGAIALADGRILSWAEDWKVWLWDWKNDLSVVYACDSIVQCCVVFQNGQIIIGDRSGRVLFLKIAEGK